MIPLMSSKRLLLSMEEKDSRIPMIRKLPNNAAIIVATYPDKVNAPAVSVPPKAIMTIATPRLAPDVIPRIDGPASGLSNAVCSIRPETANPAPAKSAVRT